MQLDVYVEDEQNLFTANLIKWSKWDIKKCNDQIDLWLHDAKEIQQMMNLKSRSIWGLNSLSETVFRQCYITHFKRQKYLPCQYWFANIKKQIENADLYIASYVLSLVYIWCQIVSDCSHLITNGVTGNRVDISQYSRSLYETPEDQYDKLHHIIIRICDKLNLPSEKKNIYEILLSIEKSLS